MDFVKLFNMSEVEARQWELFKTLNRAVIGNWGYVIEANQNYVTFWLVNPEGERCFNSFVEHGLAGIRYQQTKQIIFVLAATVGKVDK